MASNTKLKVLINGAGIAGNALAVWLSRLGHNVTVVERFPGLRTTGLQLDLRGAGIQVMKRMGIEDAIRANLAPEEGMQLVDTHGKQWAWFPVKKSGASHQSLSTEFEIMRGDLTRVLYETSLQSKTPPEYVYGTTIQSFEHKDNKVEVKFVNDKTDTFDLVVGADGQWSRTRRLMNGSYNQPDAKDDMHRFPDLFFAYFTIRRPMDNEEKYVATAYMAPGKRGILTRRHKPDQLQVMLSCSTASDRLKNTPRGDVKAEKEALAEVFDGAGWLTEEFLKGMRETDDFYCERLGLVKMDHWSRGNVTLVGDAAHCPTILTGMGTTSAMIGAYILAGEISEHVTGANGAARLEAALKSYERKFKPFMDGIQKGVLEKGTDQAIMPDSRLGIGMIYWGMRLASFVKFDIAKMWGIKETVKGWELPVYKALDG